MNNTNTAALAVFQSAQNALSFVVVTLDDDGHAIMNFAVQKCDFCEHRIVKGALKSKLTITFFDATFVVNQPNEHIKRSYAKYGVDLFGDNQ